MYRMQARKDSMLDKIESREANIQHCSSKVLCRYIKICGTAIWSYEPTYPEFLLLFTIWMVQVPNVTITSDPYLIKLALEFSNSKCCTSQKLRNSFASHLETSPLGFEILLVWFRFEANFYVCITPHSCMLGFNWLGIDFVQQLKSFYILI